MTAPTGPAIPPAIAFDRDRLRVVFDRFDVASYRLFLACKQLPESDVEFDPATESYTLTAPARFASLLGATRPPLRVAQPLWPALYDDQAELTTQALDAKRFAVWSQCGNGKTLIGLEFARQVQLLTGGRVLIVTMNDLVGQWCDEARLFYRRALPLHRLQMRSQMREWCQSGPPGVAVVNYEKFNPDPEHGQVVNECRYLAGFVCDESSRLKTGGGKQKWAIIKSTRGIEYKLSLTATPAPNDLMEFASQAAFLEKMRTETDIIWTYFTRDQKSHRWTVKPHARRAFFEWMSSWSVYVNDPKVYGWRLDKPDVPKPEYRVVEVEPTAEQLDMAAEIRAADAAAGDEAGQMTLADADGGDDCGPADRNTIQRMKCGQVANGFRYVTAKGGKGAKGKAVQRVERVPSRKPAVTAGIVRGEVAGGAQVLVWTVFDAESEILRDQLAGVAGVEVLTGKTKPAERAAMIARFKAGATRVLVTRARMLGYGQNLQCAAAMVFSGWTDSFEDLYQAVRRAARAGQRGRVRVYFPIVRELEGDTFDNVQRKEAEFEQSIAEMEVNYVRARRRLLAGRSSGKECAA